MASSTSIAYCPRASAYFRHVDHAYSRMIREGINVTLGTDSILCLDEIADERLSILDEMSLLYRRDRTDPGTLIALATINGARALGFDPSLVTLEPGPTLGLLAVPFDAGDQTASPIEQVLTHAPSIEIERL